MTRDYHTFADPTDFCRECCGKGMTTWRDHMRGVNVSETCDQCGGSGLRTVVIIRDVKNFVMKGCKWRPAE